MDAVYAPDPDRDETYFFDDGDCTFLVGGVLFKLHKTILCRDPSSMFRNLFQDAKGKPSDAIPLFDTVDDMRALCWSLYAFPSEIYQLALSPGDVDVRKHLRVVDMAQKYLLPQYESLGWKFLQAVPGAIPAYLDRCSEDDLVYSHELGIRWQSSGAPGASGAADTAVSAMKSQLLEQVENKWVQRLARGDEQVTFSRALTTGETYDRRRLQGQVYLEARKLLFLQRFVFSPSQPLNSRFNLTPKQFLRLLVGHSMLTNVLAAVRSAVSLKLPRRTSLAGCDSVYHPHCEKAFNALVWGDLERDPVVAFRRARNTGYRCVNQHLDNILPKEADLAEYFLSSATGYTISHENPPM
ncbi:hypothetical protein HMN09_00993200 [Mycena chlorophos]|uniref:BTB domain-containing protein n=1 Tax=Mycena chlorophos TaxID=658473 RepID=A0A8H6SK99_MYCCL|nr:hypothetical protein HMN09_00993200 [Mycena chlorophos]